MACAPVRSIIPSLKLGDYLSVQAHKPCSITYVSKKLGQGIKQQSAAENLTIGWVNKTLHAKL